MRRSTIAVLLAGVLSGSSIITTVAQPPDASPEPPLYLGDPIALELTAPSVWRVTEPAWDCGKAYPRQPFFDGAELAADGRLWFLDRLRGIRELGSCPIVAPKPTFGIRDQALGPDGTLWLLSDDRLWSWNEGMWRVRLEGFNQPGRTADASGGYSYGTDCEVGPCYLSVDVTPDNTVWLAGSKLTAFDGTETRDYISGPEPTAVIGFGPDGTVWARSGDDIYAIEPPTTSGLSRRQDQPMPAPSPFLDEESLASVLGSIEGLSGEVGTWTGGQWVARLDPVMHDDANAIRGLETLRVAADARLEDITIGTALVERTPGNFASVAALRIPGAHAFGLLDPAIAAMAPQIARPLSTWDRVADRSLVRVRDGAMPGAYPITFYPTGDTVWVLQADRPLVAMILQELPEQVGGPASTLRCDVLQEPFRQDFTTGDAGWDRDYLTRCVTCDEVLDLVKFARVADLEAAEAILRERCGWPPGTPATSEPSQVDATREPPGSGSLAADPWHVEVPGSGFVMRFPAGWQVELPDQDAEVFSADPGTAWEALRASTTDQSMACTVAVGVTDLAPDQSFATGIDGVSTPYWDPGESSLLWIPTPVIQGTKSVHSTDWGRRGQEDPALEHDVLYALQCVADDARFKDPDRTFERLMSSFEFLPAEGPVASAMTSSEPVGSPLPAEERFAFPEQGIAVSLPAGWQQHWDSPSLPIFESVLAAGPPDGTSECLVETFAFEGAEPSKIAETLGRVGGYDEFEISEGLALPAGDTVPEQPVVRLSAHEARGGQPGTSVAYVLAAPHGYVWLWCSTTEAPPSDHWLSIAETFEFLPSEE